MTPSYVAPFARQSTCVAIRGRGILIEGPTGSGKSSLALTLIDRGAMLVGDDSIVLERIDSTLIARPHPQTQGLCEVRQLGILPFPFATEVPVCLLLTLTPNPPRFRDTAEDFELAGLPIPHIPLSALSAGPHAQDVTLLAMKAEIALRHYGLALTAS